jgi:chromosome segregation ATPase
VHLQEVNRLREALGEQSTLVAELEDALAAKEARLAVLESEAATLRRHTAEIEEADRARRSRLAEVEGTLLRLQRQAALAASQADNVDRHDGGGSPGGVGLTNGAALAAAEAARAELERRNHLLATQVTALESRLREVDQSRLQIEQRYGEAVERMAGLETALTEQNERPATPVESAPVGDGTRVEAALREVARLREALERSEEQLWETKGQLLLDRERMAVLEHELGNATAPLPLAAEPTITEAAHQSIMKAVLTELGELESAVRAELARLDSVERLIEGWRADLSVTDAEGDAAFTGANRSS